MADLSLEVECCNYRGNSLVSVGSKLVSNMILFRLRHSVDKVLRVEQLEKVRVYLRKDRGCVDQIFTLRLIIEKRLSCHTPASMFYFFP